MTFLIVARQQIKMRRAGSPTPSRVCGRGFLEKSVFGVALLVVSALLGERNLPAQTYISRTAKAEQQQKAAGVLTQEPVVAQLPGSAALIRPANEPPNSARVSWDKRNLEIEASNSSLNQILHQVVADTGAKLEGLTKDQRVFGSYGPGPLRDVLWKLFEGSGYNVFMIGGRATGAPLEVVLSERSLNSSPTLANDQKHGDQPEPQPDDPAETPTPQPVPNPYGNGGPPRDPVQFMQEILQRQQKIDQQQQQRQNQDNSPQE
jgi:hypothetical protein